MADILDTALTTIKENPLTAGIIGGGALLGAGAITTAVVSSKIKTKRRKKRKNAKRVKRSTMSIRTSRKKHKRRYCTRKVRHRIRRPKKRKVYTSHRRIHYTRNGQPYIILPSGRARFIKLSSAKRSRRMKGGRY